MLTVIDIGTSKIAAVVGEVDENGSLKVVGVGNHPSMGMKKGIVVNIEEMVDSIKHAVEEAEIMAEHKISSVYVGVAGHHIQSFNGDGVTAIRGEEVTQADIDRAVETAQAMQIPNDQQVLHVLPREYTIDGEHGIKDPLGMSGYKLEAGVHLVTGGIHPIKNIVKCVKSCGLEVEDVVLEAIASSYAVLTDDEKELGVCLLDIGAGTSDIAIFTKGTIAYSGVIPVGGDHVSNDVAVSLRTSGQNAEIIKMKYGCTSAQLGATDEMIEVPALSEDRQPTSLSRKRLAEIIELRYKEIFSLARDELAKRSFQDTLVSGLVLTGGSAKLEGCVDLAESIFNTPVRLGLPPSLGNFDRICRDPVYATAIGLMAYAAEDMESEFSSADRRNSGDGLTKGLKGISEWIKQNF